MCSVFGRERFTLVADNLHVKMDLGMLFWILYSLSHQEIRQLTRLTYEQILKLVSECGECILH